ncbi:MAG TPA: ATP-binding protein [Rhodopseudomonas sp.]|uniref:ATP-binding protein n=1 Tax=Rhodopseudomonas sp. TaxID=1078 RepID=UPI002ED77B8A
MATAMDPGLPPPAQHGWFTWWDGSSQFSLGAALTTPTTDCVEAELGEQADWHARYRASSRHLSLTVTTRSAYRHQVIGAFVAAIDHRLQFSEDLQQRVRTAVQEATMNAMLHGNLGLGSALRGDLEGLARSHDVIESLLARPPLARSMIRIDAIWNVAILHIIVRDSGAGFKRSPPCSIESPDPMTQTSGRGLMILEAFCDRVVLLNGGTAIKLGFRL